MKKQCGTCDHWSQNPNGDEWDYGQCAASLEAGLVTEDELCFLNDSSCTYWEKKKVTDNV